MQILITGIVLWWATHIFKRLLPGVRGSLDKAIGAKATRGVLAVLLVAAVVLMYKGYRGAGFLPVYTPIAGIGHLTVLLMLFAVFLLGAGSVKGWVAAKLRHPMLYAVIIWALAHLLVNGDLASIVLFGGLGAWAIVQILLINTREGAWDRPVAGPVSKDIKLIFIALVLYAVIVGFHFAFGHNPFLGTYS